MYTPAICGLLGLVALIFSVAERSLSVFSWSRIEELPVPRSRRLAVEACLEQRELVVTCFLVLGGLAVTVLVALLTRLSTEMSLWATAGQAVLVVLLITWVLPELAAWKFRDRVVLYLVPSLYRIVGVPFRALRLVFPRSSGAPRAENGEPEGESAAEPGGRDAEAREVFKEAVRLQHTMVREIMTPRTDMVSIAESATPKQAARMSIESGYSRLPVYRGNRDQIVGVLHVKDLLKLIGNESWGQTRLTDLVRPPVFIPETKTISELMEEFQRSNTHMGIVLDEYGGTSGLVTFEDMLEELVGEIHDEHEDLKEEGPLYRRLSARRVEVQAVMRTEECNEAFNLDLPEEEDFDTLGGFVSFMLGKIPVKGESFEFGGARFTVLKADVRHVIRLGIEFRHELEETQPWRT